jgi:hypothetical protein
MSEKTNLKALARLGIEKLGAKEREITDALYMPVRDSLLSSYAWSFATFTDDLSKVASGLFLLLYLTYPTVSC